MKKYIAYHCHSDLSNLTVADSSVSPMDYINRIKDLGHTTYVSTEHGQSYGWAEKYLLCEKHNIKFVYGVEIYLEHNKKPYHCILVAKNFEGLKQINHAINDAVRNNFVNRRPRVTMEMIEKYIDRNNVYCTTSCVMGILSEPTSELFRSVLRHFGDSTLLEVQANLDERQISINNLAKTLSKRYNLKLIAGTDSHIIDNNQIIERADLIAGKGINYGEDESEDGFFMDYPDYDTLFQRFKKQGVFSDDEIKDFIDRTNIFEMCDSIVLNKDFKVPSIYPELSRKERCQKLIALINKKWNEYKVNVPTELHPKYIQEIKNELKEWFACHMEDYALTSHAIVKRGVRKGGVITTTGRGSCASYLTNMLLGFTTIDRLRTKIPILQQRFMTADKILKSHSCPDIDNNVAKIDAFVEAQEEILGENNSFPLVAFGTLKAKSAFKMLCKVKGDIPIDLQNEMSLKITEYEIDLKHAEDDERENIKLEDYLKDPELKKLYDDGSSYFGLRTDLKRHASAFCIADHDVSEIFGLCKTPGGDIVLNLEGKYMDELGYVKLDWLIVNVVELIDVVYKEIGIPTPTSRQLEDWVDSDDKVWDIYKNGITCCVNQVEQLKTRDKVMKYLPTTKEELAAIIAGVRPGFQSYYKRFENREKFNFGLPSLDDLLKGEFLDSPWMLYQEQIMLLVIWLGFEVSQSADLMKAISKKSQDKIDKIKPVFQERCIAEFVKAGVDKGEAQHRVDSIWQVIEDAANYMFNASHAYEMALDSLYLAYAKAHYPKQTYTALIRYWSEHKKVDKIYKLKVEAKKHFGFDIAPFKFRQDNRSVHMIGDTIYQSLTGVKNLNSSVGEAMYELRDYQGDYLGLRDLMIDKKLDKTHRETLIRIGYFEEFGSMGSLLWIEENYKECKIIRLDSLKKMYNELSSDITVPYDDFEKDIFNICEKRTNAQFRMKDSKDFFKYLLTVVNINDIISMNKIFFEISLLGTTTYEHGHVGIVEQVNKNGSILFSDVRTNDFKKYKLKNKNMNVSEKDIIYFNKVEENNWKWFKKDGSYLEGTSYTIANIVNLTTLFKKAKKKKGEDENE